jgi:hypothetical protein
MSPRDLSDKTPTPLKWLLAGIFAAFVAGMGYQAGQARAATVAASAEEKATAVAARMDKAEKRLDEHSESLHDKDKRLALVERAVLSLERIAARK